MEEYEESFVGRLLLSRPGIPAHVFPRLRSLDIIIDNVDSSWRQILFSPALESLIICYVGSGLDDLSRILAYIPFLTPNMTELELEYTQLRAEDDKMAAVMNNLLDNLPQLQKFLYSGSDLSKILPAISLLPKLVFLDCTGVIDSLPESNLIGQDDNFPSLRKIRIAFHGFSQATAFFQAAKNAQLREINLNIWAKPEDSQRQAQDIVDTITSFHETLEILWLQGDPFAQTCLSLQLMWLAPLGS
jgi:hypothetical protein